MATCRPVAVRSGPVAGAVAEAPPSQPNGGVMSRAFSGAFAAIPISDDEEEYEPLRRDDEWAVDEDEPEADSDEKDRAHVSSGGAGGGAVAAWASAAQRVTREIDALAEAVDGSRGAGVKDAYCPPPLHQLGTVPPRGCNTRLVRAAREWKKAMSAPLRRGTHSPPNPPHTHHSVSPSFAASHRSTRQCSFHSLRLDCRPSTVERRVSNAAPTTLRSPCSQATGEHCCGARRRAPLGRRAAVATRARSSR